MKYLLFLLTAGMALTARPVQADDPILPAGGFPASRYEILWTKSPFAVETSEAAPDTSPDYSLVGFASNINGVSYASLIQTQNNEHFLISTDKPVRDLTLKSITIGQNGSDTYAVVMKNGQPITLKLQQPPAMAMAPGVPAPNMPTPGTIAPQFPTPATDRGPPIRSPRFHRAPINLPPRATLPAPPPPPTPQ